VGAMAPPTPSTLKEKKIIKVKRKKKKKKEKKKKMFFGLLAYRKNFFWLLGHSLLSSLQLISFHLKI
jgi:hypothetical protein